jgi:hypothetical protein
MTTQQRSHPEEPGRTRDVLDHTLQAVLGDRFASGGMGPHR